MHVPSRLLVVTVLGAAILSISSGSILARLAGEAPALTIAFYRMVWATLLFLPAYVLTKHPTHASPVGMAWFLLAGGALGLHFAFWIASLFYTSVAVSVVLVTTSPVLVAMASYFLFDETLSTAGWAGIGLTIVGSIVLVWNDLLSSGSWTGAVLSLAGAAMLALYLIAGRRIRQGRSLLQYVMPTYALAAGLLLILVLASSRHLSGFSSSTYGWLFLLGLVPQCLGHTAYNWSLRFLPATVVASVILAEPMGAGLLAWWILGEQPGGLVLLGGMIVIAGIFLVTSLGVKQAGRQKIAVVIPVYRGKIFVQQRREAGPLNRLWEFPGGKIRPGEGPLEAARRELAEETGAAPPVDRFRLLMVQQHDYSDRSLALHFFVCEVTSPWDPSPNARWVTVAELQHLPTPEANAEIINRLGRVWNGPTNSTNLHE